MRRLAPVLLVVLLTGCAPVSPYQASGPVPGLPVSFSDSRWDGVRVPDGQQCRWAGGDGSTPALQIEGIPEGANALIVEFSDRSWPPMNHGGHGSFGAWLAEDQHAISLPSLAAERFELPEGLFVEHAHRGGRGEEGMYLPPCSGRRGNHYYATVRAVYKPLKPEEAARLLGQQQIELGEY